MNTATPSNDRALRDDVGTLGRLLGNLIERLEGKAAFAHVELARQAAREWRAGDAEAEPRLTRLLRGLTPDESVVVTRAFAAWFGLVNMAEKSHRIRARRARAAGGDLDDETFGHSLRALADLGVDAAAIDALLRSLRFTPVFTAHPTETVRRSLLVKEQRIAQALLAREGGARPGAEPGADPMATIEHEIGIAWQTDEHFEQPSVDDEVEHVLFFLTNVVYRVLPVLYRRLEAALGAAYGPGRPGVETASLVRFASWVGGDMDGNPNVGAETIRRTLAHHRQRILRLYRDEVRELFDHMSHSERYVTPAPALTERMAECTRDLPADVAQAPPRYAEMPYRTFLWTIWARLGATGEDAPGGFANAGELLDDLALLDMSIAGHGNTGTDLVRRLMLRVQTFGFHLATLDVRQDSVVHRGAVGEALDHAGFAALDPGARLAALRDALGAGNETPAATGATEGPLASTLDVMRAIAESRERAGEDAIGAYIISMAEGPDDVLAVLFLARRAGLIDAHGHVPLDIAPLFETVEDLERAGDTLASLLDEPRYREHVRARGDSQMVMIGYSDSNKESGLAASRWALQVAQEELVESAASAPGGPVRLTLFHGRGGTVSRGGSKPRDGILAEPPGALRGRLRVTEQGEIVAGKYGAPDSALHTLENALSALVERSALEHRDAPVEDAWREIAAEVARASRSAYRHTVLENPDLVAYFREATPIDVIERLRIGSRPPARRSGEGVGNLRAIPWVFAWTQSRLVFSGWYGAGAGLRAAIDRFGLEEVRRAARKWRFLANLLADTEMVLAKADMRIAGHYAALAGGGLGARFFPKLKQEFEQTRAVVCEIRGIDEPLDGDPELQKTLRLRNPYIDPMSLVQVDLLQRWRDGGREDAELQRALTETVRGIARGMQNAG